jgi:hypothetical protein
MASIILALAGLSENGAGETMRTYILSGFIIPTSLLLLSPWAFVQIPIITGIVFLSSRLMHRRKEALVTRCLASIFVYMVTTMMTNILLGFVVS